MLKLFIVLCLVYAWLSTTMVTASAVTIEPSFIHNGLCNEFEFLISAELSENANGTLESQIEIARVLHTKGNCFRDGAWLAGFAVAESVAAREPGDCTHSWHCRAYYLPATIDPVLRERAALAAQQVLTEAPVARYHFDAANAPRWWWWDSQLACPNGDVIVDGVRVC